MSEGRTAVVTGIGTVSAAGFEIEGTRTAFERGGAERCLIDRTAGYHLDRSARTGFRVDDAILKPLLDTKAARRMCRPSKFAVAAAGRAMDHAALTGQAPRLAAVIVSTAFGPSMVTEQLVRQILLEGPEAASPALFTESVANAPAAQIALALGARGANITITQRQAGPLLAVARGSREVLAGRAEVALVGTVDEVTPLLHAILDRFRALARPHGSQIEESRPFDGHRDGSILGEGSTMLAIESEDGARRRGAPVLARVRTAGRAFDPTAPPTGWSRESGLLADAVRRDLETNGVPLESIDGIVSGACGSRGGDRIEALVLRNVWGSLTLPAIYTPKAYLGDHGGAVLAGAVLALSGTRFAATPGFEEPDPELSVRPHDGRTHAPPSNVLVLSLATGGAGAWIVLDRASV